MNSALLDSIEGRACRADPGAFAIEDHERSHVLIHATTSSVKARASAGLLEGSTRRKALKLSATAYGAPDVTRNRLRLLALTVPPD